MAVRLAAAELPEAAVRLMAVDFPEGAVRLAAAARRGAGDGVDTRSRGISAATREVGAQTGPPRRQFDPLQSAWPCYAFAMKSRLALIAMALLASGFLWFAETTAVAAEYPVRHGFWRIGPQDCFLPPDVAVMVDALGPYCSSPRGHYYYRTTRR
jgi:hypothetical protein